MEVIKCADWVIDLGPEGGAEGGYITALGSPEEVAANESSHTGKCLAEVLAHHRPDKEPAQLAVAGDTLQRVR